MEDKNKDTPDETLPQEWRLSRIGEIAEVRGGNSFPYKYQGNKDGDFPFYKVSDMNNPGNETFMSSANNWVTQDSIQEISGRVIPANTIIFPKVGGAVYTNKKRLLSRDALIDNNVMGVTIYDDTRCLPTFLYYWFLNVDIKKFSNPGPLPSITTNAVKDGILPLPPLLEQRAIAHVLSTVRQAIESTERVIAATRELKRSMMKHLFTYGPVPIDQADQVPLKETEVGEVPEEWEVVDLGRVSQLRKEIVQPVDVPSLRYVGLEHLDSGEVQVKRFGVASDVKSSKYRFYPSDILYGKLRPYLDKCALAEWDGISSTDILILIPRDKISISNYLVHLLHSETYLDHAKSTTSGTNLPRTSWSSMKQYKFGLPNLNEQTLSANYLRAVSLKIISEESRKSALEALFNSLLHHLMTGRKRVGLLHDK